MDGDSFGRLGYLILLLAVVGGWVMVEYRSRIGAALRTLLAWGLIFVGLMAGYALWSDLRTEILPRQAVLQGGQIEVPRAPDGHYYLTLEIGGTPLRFMADTGATSVVLARQDAVRLGIDPESLLFLGEARTANGTVRTARTELRDVALGPFTDARISAFVNEGQMDQSLLGMEYLGRYRIEIAGDRMVLSR